MKEEPYELRFDIDHINDKFLSDLSTAIKKKEYVKASYLCYTIFEERIIEKHISKCPNGNRGKNERQEGLTDIRNMTGSLRDRMKVWSLLEMKCS